MKERIYLNNNRNKLEYISIFDGKQKTVHSQILIKNLLAKLSKTKFRNFSLNSEGLIIDLDGGILILSNPDMIEHEYLKEFKKQLKYLVDAMKFDKYKKNMKLKLQKIKKKRT